MFISGHFHVMSILKTGKHISCVAIEKLERQTNNNRDHPTRSLLLLVRVT